LEYDVANFPDRRILQTMSLRAKIVAPFFLLVLVAGGLTAWIGMQAADRLVRERYSRDVRNFERVQQLRQYANTPSGLDNIRKTFGDEYHLARVLPDGALISTLGSLDRDAALRLFLTGQGLSGEGAGAVSRGGVMWREGADAFNVFCGDFNDRLGYTLFVLIPESLVQTARWEILRPVLWVDAAACLAVLALGFWIASAIARPVRGLAAAARRVAAGDLDHPVNASAGGEIGALARDFNRMIDDLRASREQLVKSERLAAVGAVASGIAHEIRNPLAAMRLTAEVLQSSASQSAREGLARLAEEIDRLSRIIDELLAMGRPAPHEPVDTDVAVFLADAAAFLQRQIDHAGVRLALRTEGAGRARIDPKKMRQVFLNLVLNALQAMPRGGGLSVTASRSDGGLLISVADTGQGIAPDIRGRIFEPFFSTKPGGTGMGLALSKRIVEEHGGTIDFDSSAGGTTFSIHLP
jgi:signal transduction histidine kinase